MNRAFHKQGSGTSTATGPAGFSSFLPLARFSIDECSYVKVIKRELRRRFNRLVPGTGLWLRQVLVGCYQYFAVPNYLCSMKQFHIQLSRIWFRALKRRSQKTAKRMNWNVFNRIVRAWLPTPRVVNPRPGVRFAATTQGKSRVLNSASTDQLRRLPCKGYPYRAQGRPARAMSARWRLIRCQMCNGASLTGPSWFIKQ